MSNKQKAQDRAEQHRATIDALIQRLVVHLDEELANVGDGFNWSYVGKLAHTRDELLNLLVSMEGGSDKARLGILAECSA